jgi:hypothetical protein
MRNLARGGEEQSLVVIEVSLNIKENHFTPRFPGITDAICVPVFDATARHSPKN